MKRFLAVMATVIFCTGSYANHGMTGLGSSPLFVGLVVTVLLLMILTAINLLLCAHNMTKKSARTRRWNLMLSIPLVVLTGVAFFSFIQLALFGCILLLIKFIFIYLSYSKSQN